MMGSSEEIFWGGKSAKIQLYSAINIKRDNRNEGAYRRGGGLFNLVKMVVSVFHKDLECKVEKLKYKKLKVMQ